jgi:putative transposase
MLSYVVSYEKAVSNRPFRCQWTRLRLCLPTPKAQGRPRTHSLRDVFDAIFYVLKSGCPWRLLPHDFPPWSAVYYHFRLFRLSGLWHLILKVLCAAERMRAGKDPPTNSGHHGLPERQNHGRICPPKWLRRHKNVKGRKRHLLVDTLGLLLSVYVSPADVQDRGGAQGLLAGLEALLPRLKTIWADGAYTGETLAGWCKEQGEWELEIVERSSRADTEGFIVLPHRWIVERTFGWLTRNRRLSKDYERLVRTSETFSR